MALVVKTADGLASKARYLLEQSELATREGCLKGIIGELADAGRVALIGGALRELSYLPLSEFRSDLDFVIEVHDHASFRRFVERHQSKQNKFGGFRVSSGKVDIDFWDVQATWAHTSGNIKVRTLVDVLDATFFNVDAILYLLAEHRLWAKEGTLQALSERFLDINLRPNPNPLGATVRALRRMLEHNMQASEELVEYIGVQIDLNGWQAITKLDRAAYPSRQSLVTGVPISPKTGSDFIELLRKADNRLPIGKSQFPSVAGM